MRKDGGQTVLKTGTNYGFIQDLCGVVKTTIDFNVQKAGFYNNLLMTYPKLSDLKKPVFTSVSLIFIHPFHRTYKLLQLLLLNNLSLVAGE